MIQETLRKLPPNIWLWLGAAAVFCVSAPIFAHPLSTGLDSSGGFGLNHFFSQGIQVGRDVFFSYGPYGFLQGPLVGYNVPVVLTLLTLTKLLFIYILLRLSWRQTADQHSAWKYCAVACSIFTAFLVDLPLLMIFLTPLCLLLHHETSQLEDSKTPHRWFYVACAMAAISFVYRPLTGVIAFAALFSYAVYYLFAGPVDAGNVWQRIRINIAVPLKALGALFGFIAILWSLPYGELASIPGYIYSILEFAQGNSSAFTQNPQNNWLALGVMFAGLLILPWLTKHPKVLLYWIILIIPTYFLWKYAFSRQDHSITFLIYLMAYHLILLAYTKVVNWRILLIAALTFGGMLVNMNLSGTSHIKFAALKENSQGLSHMAALLDYDKVAQALEKQTQVNLAEDVLSDEIRQMLAGQTVDFYPWEAVMAAANPSLVWTPRPVYQSHMTIRPYFDRLNAEFLRGPKAPRYILWERDHRGGKMGSIDYRYLLNDDPMTLATLFTRYKPVAQDSRVVVFEQTENKPGLLLDPIELNTSQAEWDQWIPVPVPDNGFLRARVTAHPTWLAKFKRKIYKENDAWIEYRLVDGTVKKHRLVLDNMPSGLAIAPYITEMAIPWKTLPVEAIRLTHSASDPYDPSLDIAWELLPYPPDQPAD
ncbi:MAG: hypothetical protein KTR14_06655 [Vampirovibrio sp.]|nr:hypothetical protein [Vampirovibrio sp.]